MTVGKSVREKRGGGESTGPGCGRGHMVTRWCLYSPGAIPTRDMAKPSYCTCSPGVLPVLRLDIPPAAFFPSHATRHVPIRLFVSPVLPYVAMHCPDHPSSVFPSGRGKEERECCGASKVSINNSELAFLIPGGAHCILKLERW